MARGLPWCPLSQIHEPAGPHEQPFHTWEESPVWKFRDVKVGEDFCHSTANRLPPLPRLLPWKPSAALGSAAVGLV